MLDNRLVAAVVGGACVLAAGTGAFVATRMNAVPTETVTAAVPAADAVTETEAVVEPAGPAAPAVAPVSNLTPEGDPAPRRAEPPPRSSRRVERPRPAPRRASAPARPAASPAAPPAPSTPPPPSPAPEAVLTESLPLDRPIEVREPPRPVFEELVIPSDSVIGLRIENTVSTETALVEDEVEARVTRDVMVGSRVALPTGSRVIGHVTMVERGGKVKERARLGVRFHTLVLADGTTLPIQTETVFREGDSPAKASSAKIGGAAIGGAVLGAILGGTKGAIIGGSTGAAGGTAAVMAGGRKPATLPGGTTVTVRVLSPVTVTVER